MKRIAPLLFPLLVVLFCVNTASSQSVQFESVVKNNFPRSLIFTLDVTAPVDIEDVTLRYSISGLGRARGSPVSFTPARSVLAEVEVLTRGSDVSVPVGTTFTYFWSVTLVDGTEVVSDEVSFVFLPPGNEWVAVENSIASIYFYGNRLQLAQKLLDAATQTYEAIGRQLLKTGLDAGTVGVVLFSTENEMLEALPGRNTSFDAQVYTCGVKVAANTLYVTDGACDPVDTLRHEFVHILTDAAGVGAFGRLPSWLDEGTAVFGQSDPGAGYISAFNIAVSFDRLIPFSEMATASAEAVQVNLFYGQSYAMVGFLVELGGEEKFAELFATIKAGNRYEDALELIYGFDLSGFESAFRKAFNLPDNVEATDILEEQKESAEEASSDEASAEEAVDLIDASVSSDTNDVSGLTIGFIVSGIVLALVAVVIFITNAVLNRRLAS